MERIVFKSLKAEVDSLLEINGKIPTWLNGTLLRNGPAKFEQQEKKLAHWFDGYAMLHKFTIQNGKVTYRNRFLTPPSFNIDHEKGIITTAGSGSLPSPSGSFLKKITNIFKTVPLDNTNVSVIDFNDRYFAVSDFTRIIEFDLPTLETKGEHLFKDEVGDTFGFSSAHPCVDANTQQMFNFICELGPVVKYKLYSMDIKTGKRQLLKTFTRPKASMIHSTALTPNYYILIETPAHVNFLDIVLSEFRQKPLCEAVFWDEKDTTNFYIVNRKTKEMTILEYDAFFFFHTINAFEEGGKIIIDLSWSKRGDLMKDFYIDKLLTEGMSDDNANLPARFEIELEKKKISMQFLTSEYGELPQIHPDLATQKYRYTYCMGLNKARKGDVYNQLLKLDVQTGNHQIWHEDRTYPAEPIFVPHPNAKAEDEGVVMSVVLDAKGEQSFLLVLDGQTFTEIARVNIPHLIPMGFHGRFFPYVKENEFDKAIKENLVQEGFTLRKVFKK